MAGRKEVRHYSVVRIRLREILLLVISNVSIDHLYSAAGFYGLMISSNKLLSKRCFRVLMGKGKAGVGQTPLLGQAVERANEEFGKKWRQERGSNDIYIALRRRELRVGWENDVAENTAELYGIINGYGYRKTSDEWIGKSAWVKANNIAIVIALTFSAWSIYMLTKLVRKRKPDVSVRIDGAVMSRQLSLSQGCDVQERENLFLIEALLGKKSYAMFDVGSKSIYVGAEGNNYKVEMSFNVHDFAEYAFKSRIKIREALRLKSRIDIRYVIGLAYRYGMMRDVFRKFRFGSCIVSDTSPWEEMVVNIANKEGVSAYIYQYSLLGRMSPLMHIAGAGSAYFTSLHKEMYKTFSKQCGIREKDCIRIRYPKVTEMQEVNPSLEWLRGKKKKVDSLVVGYFDENYCSTDKKGFVACGSFFYEDLIAELEILLSFVERNPNTWVVYKSQFSRNSLRRLALNDNRVHKLVEHNRIVDMCREFGHINSVSPAEVAELADVCVGSAIGGTAVYEAVKAGSRGLLVKSGLSMYEELYTQDILCPSLEDALQRLDGMSGEKIANTMMGDWSEVNSLLEGEMSSRSNGLSL